MQNSNDFKSLFAEGSNALKMGLKLRNIIFNSLDTIDETLSGGAKVKLALYNRNGENNVLCGLQQGSNDTCMLYVHHVQELKHERLRFSGKGKHAQRIKFSSEHEIVEKDIQWLLAEVDKNAPF